MHGRGTRAMTDKRPAFQFYPADFLTDEHVITMTNAALGAYMRLLCVCWLEGSIPIDPDRLSRLCHASVIDFGELWPMIAPCFYDAGDDRLRHSRLDRERRKQDDHRKAKRKGGLVGAGVRWQNHDSVNGRTMTNDSSSSSSSSIERSNALSIRGRVRDVPRTTIADPQAGDEAARFLDRYQALYREHRHGATLRLRPTLDYQRALELLAVWPFARLEQLAVILLTTDDDWVARTDRGLGIFAARVSWCDGLLAEWEKTHGRAYGAAATLVERETS